MLHHRLYTALRCALGPCFAWRLSRALATTARRLP